MSHNSSIGCTVKECKFHSQDRNFCTLEKIEVVKHHGKEAISTECTDCGSFSAN